MFTFIESRRHVFKHNLQATLLSAVAVSRRRCVLFYSNNKYFDYDPYTQQVIREGSLPEKPFKTSLISKQQILCLLESGRIVKLMFQKSTINIGCQLYARKSEYPWIDKQHILNNQMRVFTETGSYYIQMLYKQDNKRRILYFQNEDLNEQTICQKLDESSKIIIYFQHIQEQVQWDLKIVDLKQGTDKRVIIYNPILKPGTIVSKILLKNQNQLFMFLNQPEPMILILDIDTQNITELKYKMVTNFIDVIFYDRIKQVMCLSFLKNIRINGEIVDSLIKVVDINKQQTITQSYLSLKEASIPLQKDYILDVAAQGKNGNSTIFHSRHLIRKKAILFNIMLKNGTFERFGSTIGRMVLALYDN